MYFEKKKEVAKVLARSIMNTMIEQNVPLEDCVGSRNHGGQKMTEQQRKAIEILNGIKNEQKLDGEQIISDDDYFFLLSFIIDKPQEITVAPYPVIQPFQPLTPYYGQRWEVTCKVDDNVRQSEM